VGDLGERFTWISKKKNSRGGGGSKLGLISEKGKSGAFL